MKAYEEAESKKPRVEKEEVEAAMLAKFAAERKAIQEVAGVLRHGPAKSTCPMLRCISMLQITTFLQKCDLRVPGSKNSL